MKKSIQFTGLLALLIMLRLTALSQDVTFGYDACGNRISREIVLPPMTQPQTAPDAKPANGRQVLEVSETEINNVRVVIAPNPNGGQFTVKISGMQPETDAVLYLHTNNGQLIVKKEELQAENKMDIRNRQNGTYILTLIINGRKESWKVIKQ